MAEWESYISTSESESATAGADMFTELTTHAETGTTVATYDHETDPLSVAIPELVVRFEDCHPCSLPPLYEAVDADALDDLLSSGGPELGISFHYAGYDVSVTPDSLSVTPVQ